MKVIDKMDSPCEPYPVTIIRSRFNEQVTDKLLEGCVNRLKTYGFDDYITVINVAGAVEIPLIAKLVARKHHSKAIIALGAVIQGDTKHFDYVCKQVSDGCMQVSLEFDVPVAFGVLTTDNHEQAMERVGGKHGHKGEEAADVALEMVAIQSAL